MKYLYHLGRYAQLLTQVFKQPEKKKIYFRQMLIEMKPKECEQIFKDLFDIDLQKMLNEQYLK